MYREEVEMTVKRLILEHSRNQEVITSDINLLDSHIVDSIIFIQIISAFEKEFKINFNITDLSVNKFKSIEFIVDSISRKIEE